MEYSIAISLFSLVLLTFVITKKFRKPKLQLRTAYFITVRDLRRESRNYDTKILPFKKRK
jgi:hypothetical protein